MLSTNRISIKNEDLSASLVSTSTRVLGYTVVDAEKGPCKPVRIPAGSTEKIQSIFGYTSARYPMIQEALDFNAGYDLFISAPYDATCSKVGIAYVTNKGIFAADPVELNGTYIEDLSEDSDIEIPGITSTSSLSMKKAGQFVSEAKAEASGKTVAITKSNQAVNLKAEDTLTIRTDTEERTVLIKADTDGSLGAYSHVEKSTLRETGLTKVGTVTAGTITFNSASSLPGDFFHEDSIEANLAKSTFKFYQAGENFEESTKVYAVIYQRYASNRITKISYKPQTIQKDKAFTFTVSETISPTRTISKKYTLSLDVAAKDGFGASLGYDSVLANDSFIGLYLLNDDIEGASFEEGSCSLEGTRVSPATLEDGWLFPEKPEYGDVDLFFNSEVDPDPSSSFFTLADRTPYPVQGFLFSMTPSDLEHISPLSFGPRYWNICGKFTRVSAYTKEKYVSGLVGNRALMQAKIIEGGYGGIAPMFLNENGMGGQLSVSVRKALNSWDKNEVDILTDNNYNPIIKDPTYGLLVVGQKTCQAGALSDWSYIGHVCSFIALEKALIDPVLIPQIGKPNNDYYRDLRKTQVEAYLSPRISGSRAIWADAVVDTSTREGVNDETALAAKEFRIVIKVQPNIYSEYVTLTLASYPQGVELS